MATEWYRRKGWGPKRRDEFFSRLRRCRDKSEYVRVQALELVDTRSHRAHLGAIELFDYFLKEWPDNIMLSTVLDGRAILDDEGIVVIKALSKRFDFRAGFS